MHQSTTPAKAGGAPPGFSMKAIHFDSPAVAAATRRAESAGNRARREMRVAIALARAGYRVEPGPLATRQGARQRAPRVVRPL